MDWCSVSPLNIHEDLHSQPEAWVPVGWIPKYNESLATERRVREFGSVLGVSLGTSRILIESRARLKSAIDATWN